MDASNIADSSLFSALCGLASFVANDSENLFAFKRTFTPYQISALASLLASGAEIEYLALGNELSAETSIELGEAIKHSACIRELHVNFCDTERRSRIKLAYMVAVAHSETLEQLILGHLIIDNRFMTQICDSLSTSPRLHSLTIADCELSAPLLAGRIGSFPALESLHILNGSFSPSDIEILLVSLRDLHSVADLSLVGVEVGAGGWRELGGRLLSRISGKLTLDCATLDDEGVSLIADTVLASARQRLVLQELCLNNGSIGPKGSRKLAELVSRSPYLRCLNLDWSLKIAGGGAAEILGKYANSLEKLSVCGCELDPPGVVSLLSCGCRALTVLKMGYNKAADLGAGAIARFLLRSGRRTLRELSMDRNAIGEAEAWELAKGLEKAYAIRCIIMDKNPLGPRGAAVVLNALATASTVSMDIISFLGCNIGDDGASAVGKVITRRGCRCLELTNNGIHFEGAKAIADSIKASASMIESLHLHENPLGDKGLEYLLCEITQRNRFVRELGINLSGIGVEGAIAVQRAAKAEGVLRALSCDGVVKDYKAKMILLETCEILSRSEEAVTLSLSNIEWM